MRISRFLFLLCVLMGGVFHRNALAQSQSVQTYFGKNRVQYQEFDWSYLRGENFDVYYTKGGREIATFTAKQAEAVIKSTEEMMNYRAEGRYQIILYNNATDANQTNLGVDLDQYNTGGLTRLSGNKVMVNFTGSRVDFLKELKVGIARVLVFDMLYGGNLQEKVQSSTLIFIPDWYLNGFFSYLRDGWTVQYDNALRDIVLSGKYRKFTQLLENHNQLAAHAFWYYIAETSGQTALSNIIYLTRVNRDFETALQYVLGKSIKTISKDWFPYFKKRYAANDSGRTLIQSKAALPIRKLRKDQPITQLQQSPDGKQIVYVQHKDGLSSIYLYDLETKERYKLHEVGIKYFYQTDYKQYPVVCWHPSGRTLHYWTERRSEMLFGTIQLSYKDPKDRKSLRFEREDFVVPRIEGVYEMNMSRDGSNIVLSGVRLGQRDLFLFNTLSRKLVPLTQDPYDDYDPTFVEEGKSKRVIFASNRTQDSLVFYPPSAADTFPLPETTDLFVLNISRKDKKVHRLMHTPLTNERQPLATGSRTFAFLSDDNGIWNRWNGQIDSLYLGMQDSLPIYQDTAEVYPVTNYNRNILGYTWCAKNSSLMEQLATTRKPVVQISSLRADSLLKNIGEGAITDWREKVLSDQKLKEIEDLQRKKSLMESLHLTDSLESDRTDSILKANARTPKYYFQLPYKEEDNTIASSVNDTSMSGTSFEIAKSKASNDPFRMFNTRIYERVFSLDYIVTQVGSSLFQNNIPTFVISNANQMNSNVGLILMGGTSDLMEDVKLSGGARFSFDFTNNQYYLMGELLGGRWDKKFVFFQNRFLTETGRNVFRTNNVEVMSSFTYPLSRITSLRLHGIYRRDHTELTASDVLRLPVPGNTEEWVGFRAEFVSDNTVQRQLNILYGTRYKFFMEAYNGMNGKKENMVIMGLDFRKYTKIYKQFIWANRIVGNASFGSQHMLYYLGGVDNWIIPKFDQNLKVPDQSYAFTALATNMRGFRQNARNGSNYLLINSELRLPLFSVLSSSPVSSDFFRNFQITGFADIGTAWSGFDPFSNQNPFNTTQYANGPVKVTVFTNRNPIIAGYGFGLRSRLFGYFMRFDYAWGYDDDQFQVPIAYFSLSLDF